ncbi:MAG: hypothetical protein ACLRYB_13335 [Segatella copri]
MDKIVEWMNSGHCVHPFDWKCRISVTAEYETDYHLASWNKTQG